MSKELSLSNKPTEFLLYKSPNGEIKVDVFLQNETIWMPQKKMADLFGVEVPTINYHIKQIYDSGELDPSSTIRKFLTVQKEGNRDISREIDFYNLDMIISVGYRVNSSKATQFRIWATTIIKDYIIKGYVMDVERLKDPTPIFGKDYFDEQLAKIRDIRSSERRFYQKITDIYAQCSIDYDPNAEITQLFFATVQNKLHFAITKQTAAEILVSRSNSQKKHMGLTTWKYAPNGPIRKSDVSIAKNYLNEKELKSLNRIVTMYLDYAEDQAENNIPMTMEDWIEKLNVFLNFNKKELLEDSGSVSAEIAKSFVESEFEEYRAIQDRSLESDFDRMLKKFEEKK